MDHKTKPSKVYITTFINISDEDSEGSNDTTNGQEQWGKDGTTTQLMNIAVTLQELETPKAYEHEQSNVRYYVEEPRSPIVADASG